MIAVSIEAYGRWHTLLMYTHTVTRNSWGDFQNSVDRALIEQLWCNVCSKRLSDLIYIMIIMRCRRHHLSRFCLIHSPRNSSCWEYRPTHSSCITVVMIPMDRLIKECSSRGSCRIDIMQMLHTVYGQVAGIAIGLTSMSLCLFDSTSFKAHNPISRIELTCLENMCLFRRRILRQQ